MNVRADLIGDIVAEDFKTSEIFKKFGMDFCCNGGTTVAEQCDVRGLDKEEVYQALENRPQSGGGTSIDFRSWPLDLLADYIEKTHHRNASEKIPIIQGYLDKIEQVHGGQHPELHEIKELFNENASDFAAHMKKEELILFPFIRQMVKAKTSGAELKQPRFETVENPVNMMMHEHTEQGERFEKMQELSDGYTTPADGCNTYKVTFEMMREFENDMHTHIHLENNILFPGAVALEKTFRKPEITE